MDIRTSFLCGAAACEGDEQREAAESVVMLSEAVERMSDTVKNEMQSEMRALPPPQVALPLCFPVLLLNTNPACISFSLTHSGRGC